jgi:hypothetical protein
MFINKVLQGFDQISNFGEQWLHIFKGTTGGPPGIKEQRHSLVELMNSASRMLHIIYLRSWSWSRNGIETPIHVLIPFSCVGCGSRLETGQAAGWEAKLLEPEGKQSSAENFSMAKTSGSEQAVQATNDDATISKLYLLLLIPLLSVLALEFYALWLLSLFRNLRN